ncbi:MAG: S8 family serine peptidase [Phycisphaerales bacterium]
MPSPISAPLVLSLLSLLPPPSSAPVPAAPPAAEPAHTAAAPAGPAAIHPHLLRRLAERGGTVKAWVHLKDKGGSEAERAAALASTWPERSLERRRRLRASPGLVDARDLPLCDAYLAAIEAAGAAPVHQSRWANAVSVVVDEPALRRLAALPFVLRLTPVREADRARDARIDADDGEVAPMESLAGDTAGYGLSWDQLQMINVPAVHELGARGAGVVVGILDTGFVTTHQAFNQPGHQLQVVAAWDFVNNDPVVGVEAGDPETQHVHGTLILGTLASWLQGTLIGAAPEAAYVLCKTERVDQEVPAEEDAYAAALEFCELHGADMTTSSLLYFDWYEQSDLDGQTAVCTVAVNAAIDNGLVCVTAAGNEGHDADPATSHTGAPADAFLVITCGAVEINGLVTGFSSDGPTADGRVKPEVLARGRQVATVSPWDDVSTTTASGTSLSTPLVAGAVACILGAQPEMGVQVLRRRLTATAAYQGLPAPDPLFVYGWGVIDALAALQDSCAGQADVNGDGAVDGFDLGAVLGNWGAAAPANPADINHDGVVDGMDLGLIIGSWGDCP